jgi:HEPN domain-containing protein
MPPELGEVRQWLIKGRNDWTAARKLFASAEPEIDVVAFLSQQAVEKTLKAYLLSRQVDFPKTHDLSLLLDQCAADEPSFETLRDRVEPLSQYAVAFRYPGPADLPRSAGESALRVTAEVWAFVTGLLPPGTVP